MSEYAAIIGLIIGMGLGSIITLSVISCRPSNDVTRPERYEAPEDRPKPIKPPRKR